jgi:competence protein ComEC
MSTSPIPVKGLLLARLSLQQIFQYGERIRLQGYLVAPAENEDFSYRDFLANHGVYIYIAYPSTKLLQEGLGNPFYSYMYSFKQKAISLVYSFYPDPEAPLLAGILLGDEAGISPEVQQAFRLTGTSHIIVISG